MFMYFALAMYIIYVKHLGKVYIHSKHYMTILQK